MNKLVLAAFTFVTLSAATSADETTAWQQQKCATYAQAWDQVLETIDLTQVNYAFLAANDTFIATGCNATAASVCARSRVELDAANTLTLALMNAGTASTFLPFKCPEDVEVEGGWTGPGL